MALDWSNERYVRLYRPSVDHRALCWQARAIWPLLLQEADGAGVLGARKGVAALSRAIDVPAEVVEVGIADLLDDGCLVAMPGGYVIRNYVEAQTAIMSDTSRKARQREVDRAVEALTAAAAMVSQAGSQIGHATSREVTASHDASRDVTPSRAEPSRDHSHEGAGGVEPAPRRDPDSPGALVLEATDRLNAARAKIDPAAMPITEANAREVLARLREAGPAARKRLEHALSCVEARANRECTVDALRWSSFASANAWDFVQGASVDGYAGARPGHGPRDRPPPPAKPLTGAAAAHAYAMSLATEEQST